MTSSNSDTPESVVFINSNVPDLQDLLGGLAPGVEAFVIDPSSDGLAQMAAILAANDLSNLSSISIVGHGAAGEIQVGSTTLDAGDLSSESAALAQIGAALAPGGDLQLYACDVASGTAGQQFIADLSQYVGGAAIAASSNLVGDAAEGGSWALNVDVGAADVASPFTAAATAAYSGVLGIASNLVWYATFFSGGDVDTGVYTIDVSGGAAATNSTDVESTPSYGFVDVDGLAIDPSAGHYFVANFFPSGNSDVNQIIEGNTNGSGTPSVIDTSGNSGGDAIVGLAFDPQNGLLYFAATDANIPGTNTDTGIYTINALGTGVQTAHKLVDLSSGANAPNDIAIDTTNNLLFYTDGVPGLSNVEEVGVANLATGLPINGDLVSYSASVEPYGIAVNPATDTLYWTTIDDSDNSGDAIYSATYSTGPSVTLSDNETLATTSTGQMPIGIGLDVPAGGYYVDTANGSTTENESNEVLWGSSLTSPEALTTVYSIPEANGDEFVPTEAIVVEVQPVISASGTVTAISGGSAVTADPGATASDADGYDLASATISGALTDDTLSFNGGNPYTFSDGDEISSSFSSGTLTLTGIATAADYKTALDSVTFSTTSTSATPRTLDWTVSDGVVSSATATSTVNVDVPPVIGGTGNNVKFYQSQGSTGTTLDGSGITVTDGNGANITSASVTISSALADDELVIPSADLTGNTITGTSITVSGNDSATLTLSGSDTAAHYQQALRDVTYDFSGGGDPTDGGTDKTRTIAWSVTDADTLTSAAGSTTTLDVYALPIVSVGSALTPTYTGTSAVTADSTLSVTDYNGTTLAGATVTVTNASDQYVTGDSLNFTPTGDGITIQSNTGGVLILTGAASVTDYDDALNSITFSSTSTTSGTRTLTWEVNDEAGGNTNDSTPVTTNIDVDFKSSPTLTTSPTPTTVALPNAAPVTFTDTATLVGGSSPTGSIVFTLVGPNSTTLYTDVVTVSGDDSYSTASGTNPGGYTLPGSGTVAGTYQWDASYNGDTNNNAFNDTNNVNEQVTVSPATPGIGTSQQQTFATAGASIADQATVSGAFDPTGTVTFNLYNNSAGTGTPLFTDANVALSNGVATSADYATSATGTDYWVATYNGNSNNTSVSSGDAAEPVTVTPATPTLATTQQPASTTVGDAVADQATISGGFDPTGTVTFNLYNNSAGTGTPLFTDANVALSNGVATSAGYATSATGTDYWVATYSGNSNNISVTSGTALEPVSVTPATPSISTSQQPAAATVDTSISDTATVSGGFNPTGTVTFNLYDDPNGTGTALFTDANVALSNGVATSAGYTTLATGTDYWVVTYSGNSNNSSVTSGTALEPVSVTPASPSISTSQQQVTATVDTSISDTATVSGGFNPTGTVTFNLYDDPNGTGTALFTDTETLAGGTATSAGYTTQATGTDYWVATYSGNSNNSSVTSGTALEPVSVTPASPSISTSQQQVTATVDTSISDTATVSGGFNPTGTVTFNLYDDPNGTGTALFTDTETLASGTATSAGYTTQAPGTDYWVATYNGDSNNTSVSSGDAAEPVMVTAATPSITTTASADVTLSSNATGPLSDSATLAGGFDPTGTITFTLVGPDGFSYTQTDTVSGNGAYTASTTLPSSGTVAGIYQWDTSYSGDGNNSAASDQGGPAEQTTVSPASSIVTTTPSPNVTLSAAPVTLTDTATLAGAFDPTGTITFTLIAPGDVTPVNTETVTVNGDGTYQTPTGYTLPGSGTVIGTYSWAATYSGDGNNIGATEYGEQTTVSPASSIVTTTPSPNVTLSAAPVTLTDTAILSGAFGPTGTITFTLIASGGVTPVDTETVTVNGDGTYQTPTGYTLPGSGTVIGTYSWAATYSGDANNIGATEFGEQTTVSPASSIVTTTPSPNVTLSAAPVTLTDTATLSGAFDPTGTITFTLIAPGGVTPVDTETVTVNGDGTYQTPTGYTLPGSGTVIGTYSWAATYSGDGNNIGATEFGEQTAVSAAKPTLTTVASPTTVTDPASGVTLTDTATLAGGYDPTGTITFKLTGPGNTTVDTETDTVNGNKTYTTPIGYKLPSSGTVSGTYTWVATYSGETNNSTATDNGTDEQTAVSSPPTIAGTVANQQTTAEAPVQPFSRVTIGDPNANATDTLTITLATTGAKLGTLSATSSVKPSHLLTGKILGVAAVGFTQYLIWGLSGILLTGYGASMASAMVPGASLPNLHLPASLLVYAAVFFLVSYLLYASMYAALGAMVSSDEELQQVQLPVTLMLVVSFLIYPVIMRDPRLRDFSAPLTIPFFAPVLMVLRIALQMPPFWQIALSLLLSLLTTAGIVQVSAKIYRVGILMYGKRPSLVEVLRWLRYT